MKEAIKDAPKNNLESRETAATEQSHANTQHNRCREWHERKPRYQISTTSYNSGKSISQIFSQSADNI